MLMTLLRAGPGPMIEKALEIDIKIEADAWVDELPQLVRLVDLSAAAAVAACDLECGNTELSILMTDDAEMSKLNREWREVTVRQMCFRSLATSAVQADSCWAMWCWRLRR